jgi:type I restriction enzyme S subunit
MDNQNKNIWVKKKINEICTIISGSTPKTSEPSYWNGGISWVTPYDLSKLKDKYISNGNRNITELGLKNCSAKLLPVNSLIMSSRAPIGYFAINKKPVATNQGCKSFICDNSIDTEFLYYSLNQVIDSIKKVGSGSTFAEVGKSSLEKITILVPQKSIQQKIALILSSVDEEIQKTDQIIKKTEKLKNGLMSKLLTKGIGHTKFKKTKIGEIPEKWEVTTVGEICDCIVPGRNKPKIFDGDIPWITIPNIHGSEIQYNNSTKYVSRQELKNCGNKIIPISSVIMSCVGDFGMVVVTDKEIAINQQLHAFLPSKQLDQNFLKFVLISQKKYMENLATKTSIPYLNKTSCNSIPIVKPPIEEQSKIAKILSMLEEKILKERINNKYFINIKNGLMDDIFSQKVEVS